MNSSKFLVDPEARGALEAADDAALGRLRAAIGAGRARRRDGGPVPAFDGAYLAQGGRVAYLVEGGVPNFVVDERLELDGPL